MITLVHCTVVKNVCEWTEMLYAFGPAWGKLFSDCKCHNYLSYITMCDWPIKPFQVMPDNSRGSVKTKHHFSTQVNESKHIKLDGGHGPPSPAAGSHEELRCVMIIIYASWCTCRSYLFLSVIWSVCLFIFLYLSSSVSVNLFLPCLKQDDTYIILPNLLGYWSSLCC